MSTSKLGKRYRCFECSCAFFDMGKNEPICPRCGADQKKAPKNTLLSRAKSSAKKMEKLKFHDIATDDHVETEAREMEDVDLEDGKVMKKKLVEMAVEE
jgi:hypothetical protein